MINDNIFLEIFEGFILIYLNVFIFFDLMSRYMMKI